jgi:hypothetical protein
MTEAQHAICDLLEHARSRSRQLGRHDLIVLTGSLLRRITSRPATSHSDSEDEREVCTRVGRMLSMTSDEWLQQAGALLRVLSLHAPLTCDALITRRWLARQTEVRLTMGDT